MVIVHLIINFIRATLSDSTTIDQSLSQLIEQDSEDYSWIIRLIVNCFGYSCIFIPGILIYRYTKRIKYVERSNRNFMTWAVKCCFNGSDSDKIDLLNIASKVTVGGSNAARTPVKEFGLLCYCFFGLIISYLTWGVLQEKIMTKEYLHLDGKTKTHFRDSQFLVFTNRILAFVIACFYLLFKAQIRHRAPLYKYSFASISNIMSAWFQYEALKFVNFPTQVLAKSCKIIPVMLMGKIISRNKYEFYEYLTAILISIGMIFFLTGSADESKNKTAITTLTGVFLLTLYMIFDSFTSNWQGDLFKTYSMSSIQMMCGVNLFSSLLTASSIFIQGGFLVSLQFAVDHPQFIVDCIVLSISSAIGQLFIFYTISTFGAVVFTIIMTFRQVSI